MTARKRQSRAIAARVDARREALFASFALTLSLSLGLTLGLGLILRLIGP